MRVSRGDLSDAVLAAVRAAVTAGELDVTVPESAPLSWGDGVCRSAIALRLAAGSPAVDVARIIGRRLLPAPGVAGVRVDDRGFLEIDWTPELILERAARLGRLPALEAATWADRPRTFDNPGFAVRFGYARAAAVVRWAEELHVPAQAPDGLQAPEERRLVGRLGELSERAERRDAGVLRKQLVRTAEAYHNVHERCPALPKGDEPVTRLHGARVALAGAVRLALNDGLRMLGETPRERI